MKDSVVRTVSVGLRGARGRPDSWLVGAFLVLFGVAVSAALPQISGAVRTAIADAAKSGATERAQRPNIRLHFVGVRVVQPKVPGGQDLIQPSAPSVAIVALHHQIFARPADLAATARERGFRARAPPASAA